MNSLSMDPKLTLAVYIGGGLLFLGFLAWMFIYNIRMTRAESAKATLGRPAVDMEENILIATREKEHHGIPKP